MSKQVIEQKFIEDVKKLECHWIEKIQVNPFAFTSTSADFSIQNEKYDILVECKQVSMNDRKTNPSFQISRLTQETKLFQFHQRLYRNKAYIFLSFWNKNKEKSNTFLIPILIWIDFRRKYKKSTIDLEIFSGLFSNCLVDTKFGTWEIDFDMELK